MLRVCARDFCCDATDNVKKKEMIEKTLQETMQAVLKATEEVKRLQKEHDATEKVGDHVMWEPQTRFSGVCESHC